MAISEVEMAVPAKKTIALVAHDNMKDELLEWVSAHKDELANHTLIGTGTTGRLVNEQTGLAVERLRSGPLGGDQQIGAKIAEGKIDPVTGKFTAETILAKHDEKYMPPEVAGAMKKTGAVSTGG